MWERLAMKRSRRIGLALSGIYRADENPFVVGYDGGIT
jgi:hypothetical protein